MPSPKPSGELPASPPSQRATVRRLPARGAYDRATIDAILDEGIVCHVGLATPEGPVVIPTGYVRDGDRLLLHGSRASRLMRALAGGEPACVTVTLLDAVVLARSGFNHSMDYRSVVVFGRASRVPDDAKEAALRTIMQRLFPGRWDTLRPVHPNELAQTDVVAIPLDEASAKVRAHGVNDDPEDLGFPVWAGTIPLRIQALPPVPAPRVVGSVPSGLAQWTPERRGGSWNGS